MSAAPLPAPETGVPEQGSTPNALYVDVLALLNGGLPDPPEPTVMRTAAGYSLFYEGQVNLMFGDPECGKSWIALAASAEALIAGHKVLVVDCDHNGPAATIARLVDLGAPVDALTTTELFRYVEPEDRQHLERVVTDCRLWRPQVAVIDSVGELMPLLGLNSNSPDEFTTGHALVLKPLAQAGAAVLAIDHLPKSADSRAAGPTGTAAKRRAIGGVSVRVEIKDPFTPGSGGSASLRLDKDRHGGLRQHLASDRQPQAGVFVMTTPSTGSSGRSPRRRPERRRLSCHESRPTPGLS